MKYTNPIECLIEAFGSTKEVARLLGITSQGVSWLKTKKAGNLTDVHIRRLLPVIKEEGHSITAEELLFGRVEYEEIPEPMDVSGDYQG